jgi:hypothetical protein
VNAIPSYKLSWLKNSIILDSDIERMASLIEKILAEKQSKIFINY